MKKYNLKNSWPLLIVLVVYSLLAMGYFLSYDMASFPDGLSHMGYVYDVYRHNYPDYINGVNYAGGKLNHLNHPALYYLLTGIFVKLDITGDYLVIMAQSVNYFISLLILIGIWCVLQKLNFSSVGTFVGLLIILLSPMFIELGISVNNDPLSILGCVIAFYGIVSCYSENRKFTNSILCIVIGGAVASLTKGTGILTIVCMTVLHVIVNFKIWWQLVKKIKINQWAIILLISFVVFLYFLVTYKHYHVLFPVPQGNPADWFAITHPNAPRWSVMEHIQQFFISNYNTLTIPYGQVGFIDSYSRDAVLDVSMVLFLVLIVIFSVFGSKNNFARIGWLSFIVFMTIYFYTIRKMHIQTGYQGAMQARYFFGFLPLFSIGLATVYEKLSIKPLRAFFLMTVVSNVALAFLPSWEKVGDQIKNNTIVEQKIFNTTFGELTKGRYFAQTFKAKKTDLDSISLKLATFVRKNDDTVIISICDTEGKCPFSKRIHTTALVDNAWLSVKTNLQGLTVGKQYIIKLTSLSGTPGNAITWWALQQSSEDPHFIHTNTGPTIVLVKSPDIGDAIVDGNVATGAQFSFIVIFK